MCRQCDIESLSADGRNDRFELSARLEQLIIDRYGLSGLVEKYITEVYDDRQLSAETRRKLFHSVFQPLNTAAKEGYGQVVVNVEYGTPNFEMLRNLQLNADVFAAFKNHAMVKEMAGLLKDDQGNLRSFREFRDQALKVDAKYRTQWLQTEYDTAVRTARMAAQWEQIKASARFYPNLEYVRTRSANPRDEHLALVGTILPINDPFWNIWYPPNGWNCKCSVRPTDKEPTDTPDAIPPITPGFDFHPGKTGELFSLKNTEYIKAAAPSERPALIRETKKEVNKTIIEDLRPIQLYQSKSGGKVTAHPLTFNNSDFNQNLNVAREIANRGHKLDMLPDIEDQALRQRWMPKGVKGNKNPDFLIDGKHVADLKTLIEPTKKAVHNKLKECRAQCDNIIIDVVDENPISYSNLIQWTKGKVKREQYKDFGLIWIRYKGRWQFLDRQQILDYEF